MSIQFAEQTEQPNATVTKEEQDVPEPNCGDTVLSIRRDKSGKTDATAAANITHPAEYDSLRHSLP